MTCLLCKPSASAITSAGVWRTSWRSPATQVAYGALSAHQPEPPFDDASALGGMRVRWTAGAVYNCVWLISKRCRERGTLPPRDAASIGMLVAHQSDVGLDTSPASRRGCCGWSGCGGGPGPGPDLVGEQLSR